MASFPNTALNAYPNPVGAYAPKPTGNTTGFGHYAPWVPPLGQPLSNVSPQGSSPYTALSQAPKRFTPEQNMQANYGACPTALSSPQRNTAFNNRPFTQAGYAPPPPLVQHHYYASPPQGRKKSKAQKFMLTTSAVVAGLGITIGTILGLVTLKYPGLLKTMGFAADKRMFKRTAAVADAWKNPENNTLFKKLSSIIKALKQPDATKAAATVQTQETANDVQDILSFLGIKPKEVSMIQSNLAGFTQNTQTALTEVMENMKFFSSLRKSFEDNGGAEAIGALPKTLKDFSEMAHSLNQEILPKANQTIETIRKEVKNISDVSQDLAENTHNTLAALEKAATQIESTAKQAGKTANFYNPGSWIPFTQKEK